MQEEKQQAERKVMKGIKKKTEEKEIKMKKAAAEEGEAGSTQKQCGDGNRSGCLQFHLLSF